MATVGIVVTVSLIVHGATALPFTAFYQRRVQKEMLAEERESTATGLFVKNLESVARVRPPELKRC